MLEKIDELGICLQTEPPEIHEEYILLSLGKLG